MSLWGKKKDILSMPVWYARRAMFKGSEIVDGFISLAHSNTSFADGDAVAYFAETPLEGLSNGEVYFVKVSGDRKIQLASSADGEGIAVAAADGDHMLVKCDTEDTTEDGTKAYAIIAVDREMAARRILGMVSPGWYRYRKYMQGDKPRIHCELLAFLKGDFEAAPLESFDGDSENVNTPDQDVAYGDVVLEAAAAKSITGKSVSVNALNVSDSAMFTLTSTEGNITVKSGEIVSTRITLNAA